MQMKGCMRRRLQKKRTESKKNIFSPEGIWLGLNNNHFYITFPKSSVLVLTQRDNFDKIDEYLKKGIFVSADLVMSYHIPVDK